MNIVMIGSGRLATQLVVALKAAGHQLLQVFSPTAAHAQALAKRVGAEAVTTVDALRSDADVYFLAVKDSVLPSLIPEVCKGREDALFLHTAGSLSKDLFQGYAKHYGVFYPMQTFSKERDVDFRKIPVFLEADSAATLQTMKSLATSISELVYELSSEDRRYLHLAAVFACNFVNHCYTLSAEVLEKVHLPFKVMLPLIDETARKVHELSPVAAQTGPAVREDGNVMEAQKRLLDDDPRMQEIYQLMSESIIKNKNND